MLEDLNPIDFKRFWRSGVLGSPHGLPEDHEGLLRSDTFGLLDTLQSSLVKKPEPKRPAPRPDEAFGVEEAARRLNCSMKRVRELVHQNRLPHAWQGKNLKFHSRHIDEYWERETLRADQRKARVPPETRVGRKGAQKTRKSIREEMKTWV